MQKACRQKLGLGFPMKTKLRTPVEELFLSFDLKFGLKQLQLSPEAKTMHVSSLLR